MECARTPDREGRSPPGNIRAAGPFLNFVSDGFPYNAQRIASLILAAAAIVVVIFWGPRTLARLRLPGTGGS